MSIDAIELRNSLGKFATGVCVISAAPEGGKPFAMTVNSFAAVSLDPALVLWSLQNDSECYDAFEAAETYSISILSEEQMDLSNRYARKGDHDLLEEDFFIGEGGTPVIKDSLVSFECKIWQRYPGGDHVILVGEVINMINHNDNAPLLFNVGKYKKTASL